MPRCQKMHIIENFAEIQAPQHVTSSKKKSWHVVSSDPMSGMK